MNEQEIGAMLVRLLGDASGLMATYKEAAEGAEKTAKATESAAERVQAAARSVESFGKQVVSTLSSLGLAATLKGAFESFSSMQTTMMRLRASVEASGKAVESTMAMYQEFSEEMNRTTLQTTVSTRALLQQAETMGASGRAAEEATRYAVALAAARGGEASAYIRAGVALEQGNAMMLRHMLRMRGVKDESEVMARAQKLVAAGTKIAAQEMETAAGQLKKLQKSLMDVSREIGGMVADVLLPTVKAVRYAVEAWKTWDPTIRAVTTAAVVLFLAIVPLKMVFGAVSFAVTTTIGVVTGTVGAFTASAAAVWRHTAALTANAAAARASAIANATAVGGLGLSGAAATGSAAAGGASITAGLAKGGLGTSIGTTLASSVALAGGLALTASAASVALLLGLEEKLFGVVRKTQEVHDANERVREEAAAAGEAADDRQLNREALKASAILEQGRNIEDLGEKQAFLGKASADADKLVEDRTRIVKDLKKQIESTKENEGWIDWASSLAHGNGIIKQLEGELGAAENRLSSAKGHADGLAKALAKVTMTDQQREEFERFGEKLELAHETIGMSAAEKYIHTQRKKGVPITFEEEAGLRGLEQESAAIVAVERATEAARKHNEAMLDKVAAYDFTADAAKRYKLAQQGASDEEIAKMAVNEEIVRRLAATKKMLDEGEAERKKVMLPEEKQAEERKRLDGLLQAGAISAETYARALNKVEAGAKAATGAFKDSTELGSAAALSRIQEFSESVKVRPVELDVRAQGDIGGAVEARLTEERTKNAYREAVFNDMRDYLRILAEREGFTLVPANVE